MVLDTSNIAKGRYQPKLIQAQYYFIITVFHLVKNQFRDFTLHGKIYKPRLGSPGSQPIHVTCLSFIAFKEIFGEVKTSTKESQNGA